MAKDHSCSLFPYEREDFFSIQEVKQESPWSITAFNLPGAWSITQGEGVTIAVLDSTPGWSPVLVRETSSKTIKVMTIEEVYKKTSGGTSHTCKGEEIKQVFDLEVWSGHTKQGKHWQKIKHVIRHPYVGKMFKINLRGGVVDVTPNHSVIGSNGAVFDASEVSVGSKMCLAKLDKLAKNKGFFRGTTDSAWVMGFWSAEGSVHHTVSNGNYNVTWSQKDVEPLLKVQSVLSVEWHVHSRIDGPDEDGMHKLVVSNKKFHDWVLENWLTIDGQKKVPDDVLNSPESVALAYLMGYNLGDGYHKENRLSWEFKSWTTIDQVLACGLLVLVEKYLDQSYTIQTRVDKPSVTQITLNEPGSKRAIKDRSVVQKIHEFQFQGMVYDLETEDHTFGCGIGLVRIHNTGCDLDHPDLKENLLEGKNFVDHDKPPEDDNGHGCVSPDCLIHTTHSGIDTIESLYDKLDEKEEFITHSDGMYCVKHVSKIKTYSFDVKSQQTVIGEIDSIQKLPICGEVVKITLEGGEEYSLTPWHPVYLLDNRHHDVYDVVRKRSDLVVAGDHFIFGRGPVAGHLNKENPPLFLPPRYVCQNCGHRPKCWRGDSPGKCKKCKHHIWDAICDEINLNEDLAYLAGLCLTDGHISLASDRFEITSTTQELLVEAEKIATDFGWTTKVESSRIIVYGWNAVQTMLSLGILAGKESLAQTLPEWVGLATYECVTSFLAGVIDGDGCISKNNTKNRITTGNVDFSRKMAALFNSIGISAYVSGPHLDLRNRQIKSIHPVYKITHLAVGEEIAAKLVHPVKSIRASRISSGTIRTRRVKSVAFEKFSGFFYDFTVQDHHNYLANGHFVSNTHISGTLVAVNNGIGIVGVAPKAKVIPVKVLDNQGNGSLLTVAVGIRWCINQKVDLISLSLGAPVPVQQVRKAIQAAAQAGIVTFCAAGNAGNTKEIYYPGAYPEAISIGAIDPSMKRADFSNTGSRLDFMAPGVDVLSTVPDDWYAKLSGTSMAQPFACGVAALVLSYARSHSGCGIVLRNAEDYRNLFKQYTTPVNNGNYTDPHFYQGFGIIDPRKFMEAMNKPH